MKLFRLLIFALCALFIQAQARHQLHADIDGITIPYGTKFELEMAQDITTTYITEGDMFQAYLMQDVYVNNKLVLPSRTIFRGRVSAVEYSKNLSRPAVLYLTLDHLVTKTGAQLPLKSGIASDFAYILKSDGALTTDGGYFRAVSRDVKKAGAIVPRTIKWGQTAGDHIFKGSKILFVPVAAFGGVVACVSSSVYNSIADIFRHGDEIIIKSGTPFSIILLSALDVPS